jgi:hypothetical protein
MPAPSAEIHLRYCELYNSARRADKGRVLLGPGEPDALAPVDATERA